MIIDAAGFQVTKLNASGIISRQEVEHWRAASTLIYMGESGAKVCRGGCGIAIFGVYRDKSRFLTFAATNRDYLLFPRYVAIFVVFHVRSRFHCLLTVEFPGFLRCGPT